MIEGKVVHADKYGYGITWRRDKFDRVSVRFQSGKEIGGLADTDLRYIDKKEFQENDVLSHLKAVGLSDYLSNDVENEATESIVQNYDMQVNVFRDMQKAISGILSGESLTPSVIEKTKTIVESSNVDEYTKGKIVKRLSKIKDDDKLRKYIDNSRMRLESIEKKMSITKLNIDLTNVVKEIFGQYKND